MDHLYPVSCVDMDLSDGDLGELLKMFAVEQHPDAIDGNLSKEDPEYEVLDQLMGSSRKARKKRKTIKKRIHKYTKEELIQQFGDVNGNTIYCYFKKNKTQELKAGIPAEITCEDNTYMD